MEKKKSKYVQVMMVSSFLALMPVEAFAACDYKTQNELKAAAASVEAKYEIKSIITDYNGVEHPEISEELATTRDSGYMKTSIVTLNIMNITNDLYFKIENNVDNLNETHYSTELENNQYKVTVPDVDKIREYKITIFSNNQECISEELRTITIKTPKFNDLSGLGACQDSDKYYCQEFVTEEPNITEEELIDKQEGYKGSLEEQKEENSPLQKSKVIVIITIISVLAIFGIVGFIYKKSLRKKRI